MIRRGLALAGALSLAAAAPGCSRAEQPAEGGAVVDEALAAVGQALTAAPLSPGVTIAPIADRHPWVIALLTAIAVDAPAGIDARLDGRITVGGQELADPVLRADTRELLGERLAAHERSHPRPPELQPVWERLAGPGGGTGSGVRWQLHFVELGPDAGGFELDDEARVALRTTAFGEVVALTLGPAQREQLAALTAARIGRRVAVVLADEALMVAVVRDAIRGGEVHIELGPGEDREAAAEALHARLSQAD